MIEAFEQAALRHYEDAETLKDRGAYPNADHLFGFAAECALKVALARTPGQLTGEGNLTKGYYLHINKLWGPAALLMSSTRLFPGLYTVLKSTNPFNDWSEEQRYASGEYITPAVVEKHRSAAQRLMGAVNLKGKRKER